ncbi:hypothetical protein [Massilia sp. TSP1-1-2]|uniref:hypothetical protein n=1 Tax=Massilia sp. TSP1-1-2 TaxID=2804649 RepID=UPI003CF03EE2
MRIDDLLIQRFHGRHRVRVQHAVLIDKIGQVAALQWTEVRHRGWRKAKGKRTFMGRVDYGGNIVIPTGGCGAHAAAVRK